MDRAEEWNEFLDRLLSCAAAERKAAVEYEYQEQRREQIDEDLDTNLTPDQRDMVEELLFELGLAADRKASALYRRGLEDCVWLLKTLGVLA